MLLAWKLLAEHNERGRRRIEKIAPSAARILSRYEWPGNVRELRNVIEYAYAIGDGPVLVPSDLPTELTEAGAADVAPDTGTMPEREDPETRRIVVALERSAGSRERAAKVLGMSRVTLWRKMKSLGLA